MANNLKASSLSTIRDRSSQCQEEFMISRIMEVKQRRTNQFQDTSKAKSSSPSSTKAVGSKITPKDIVENLQDSSNGLQQVTNLLQAPLIDGVAQESSPLLDDLAEIKKGLQQCFDLLHQQAPPQEEAVQDIFEFPSSKLLNNRQEMTSMTKVFKKLDDMTASMQFLEVDLDGIVNKVDESTLRERISKFQDDIQCSLKVIIEKVQVHARTDEQDTEVKNHESCATNLDQNEGSIRITNQKQEDIKNIVMSSSTVAEPCVINNQDLEVEGASSKIMLQEGISNKQGPPQYKQGPPQYSHDVIDPEASVDQDHDMQHHDKVEPPQEETKEDDPLEDVKTPESTSHGSKMMQQKGVSNKQGPPQDVDEVKDSSVERDQEYDLQFPSLRPCKEGPSQARMNHGVRLQEKDKAKHVDAVEKKPMHKGDVKQSPEIIAEICKREVAVLGTHAESNRFSLGEYFTFTKTTESKKAKKKPQKC